MNSGPCFHQANGWNEYFTWISSMETQCIGGCFLGHMEPQFTGGYFLGKTARVYNCLPGAPSFNLRLSGDNHFKSRYAIYRWTDRIVDKPVSKQM